MSPLFQKSLINFVLSPNNVRRLQPKHLPQVEKLKLMNTEYIFGDRPVEMHLSKNYLSLGIYDEFDELGGVICLSDHPNVPAIPPWEWVHWLYNLYGICDVDSFNVLWIHYAVWDRRYTCFFLKPILQHLFRAEVHLQKVMMVCPPAISKLDFIEDSAERVLPINFYNALKVQTIYVIKREDFIAHYTIRKAVEEDNDDLVTIMPKVVEEHYGQYYISEMLNLPEEIENHRQIIVAEHKGCAVGVLCLNKEVNYDLLNDEFELVPYNGFRKPSKSDEILINKTPSPATMTIYEDAERLSNSIIKEESKEESSPASSEEQDSEDDFSLVNLSSSMILNYLYEDDVSENLPLVESETSIDSHFSAVVLNEEYQDHLATSNKPDMVYDTDRKVPPKWNRIQEETMTPTFHGEPNAFTLEICTAVAEHESCLFLLFQAAFECFPHRDYMLVSFPPGSNVCYLMRHFVRVAPRSTSVFSHELYVLHKHAVLSKLSVRVGIPQDIKKICELTRTLIKPQIVQDQFKEAVLVQQSPLKAYTFLSEKQIIGCAVLCEEDEHEYLELHYDLHSWLNLGYNKFGMFGLLEQFLLSPIFQRHIGFFLRELARMTHYYVIFYRLKTYDYMYNHKPLLLLDSIVHMVPVQPNKIPEYDEKITDEFRLPTSLLKKHQSFALYLTSPRLISMPRIEINSRIVVVGTGCTATSFLGALVFGQDPSCLVTFNNLAVVSPHGLSYHKHPSKIRDMMFVGNGHLDRRYIDMTCLKTYVHVVAGVMTSINRKEKYLGLNDDSYIPYDYLFLMCGAQFQKPPIQKKQPDKNNRIEFPQNVFIINTEADAGTAFNALKSFADMKISGKMVVFGHYLEACCCLAALLEFGVEAHNLVYIDPTPDSNPTGERHDHLTQFFNNSHVENAVFTEMLNKGITIYQDYNFVEWYCDSSSVVTSAKFESKYKFVEIELTALFIYHSKGVSYRTFQAIIRSGLVFNGHLIIDKNYQTNDPFIYGAGSLTKYSQKYYAEHLMHKYYNCEEIGADVAENMRRKLIPEKYWDAPAKPRLRRKPIVQHCIFPGNLNYLQVSKPGKPVPLDVAISKCTYGRVLMTGDCNKLDKQGYFRLHLNQYNTVETITCLAKFELNVQNLISLYGKHEVLLNNLLLRYDLNMIDDLFSYFNEPWACAIYHQKFQITMDEIDQLFRTIKTEDGEVLIDEIRHMFEENGWNQLDRIQMDEMEELCKHTVLFEKIEKKVLDFLHDNYLYLPMYVHQMFIGWLMYQVQASPLFVRTTLLTYDKKVSYGVSPFGRKEARSIF